MADLNIDGMNVAGGVVETIVSLAVRDVEGVAGLGDAGAGGILTLISGGKPSTQGIEVDLDEAGELHVSVHLHVKSGQVLPDVAAAVRQAVADAVSTQVGAKVGAVDVFIDGIEFED